MGPASMGFKQIYDILDEVSSYKLRMSCNTRGFNWVLSEVCRMWQKRAPVTSGSLEWKFNIRVVIKYFIVGWLVSLCIWIIINYWGLYSSLIILITHGICSLGLFALANVLLGILFILMGV